MINATSIGFAGTLLFAATLSTPSSAQSLAMNDPVNRYQASIFAPVMPAETEADPSDRTEIAGHLRRQIVAYPTRETPGTVIIDTPNTYLYYVLGNGRAVRYGIGVGRDGFTWAGTQQIGRKAEWPDWHPPAEMIARQPYLPRFMAGGPTNPLGARALYLGNTVYRIHGTNAPSTIGGRVSSGCIRMLNEDVTDLYDRVTVGTKVVVLPDTRHRAPAVAERERVVPVSQAYAPYERQSTRMPARGDEIPANRTYYRSAIY